MNAVRRTDLVPGVVQKDCAAERGTQAMAVTDKWVGTVCTCASKK